MKAAACLLLLLLTCACRAKVQPDAHRAVSMNPVCALDVEKARDLAQSGDLTSARELRGYSVDCVKGDYATPWKAWAAVAVRLGDKTDQQEYMNVLQEGRFDREGREWESPANCGREEDIRAHQATSRKDLAQMHRLLAFNIECEKAGISPNILSLAKRAAAIGNGADKEFYDDLVTTKPKRSR